MSMEVLPIIYVKSCVILIVLDCSVVLDCSISISIIQWRPVIQTVFMGVITSTNPFILQVYSNFTTENRNGGHFF